MFEELKPLLANGERVVIVEGGRPEYVVLRIPDYIALVAGSRVGMPSPRVAPERDPFSSVNAELTETVTGRIPSGLPVGNFEGEGSLVDPTTVRLEDLPL